MYIEFFSYNEWIRVNIKEKLVNKIKNKVSFLVLIRIDFILDTLIAVYLSNVLVIL